MSSVKYFLTHKDFCQHNNSNQTRSDGIRWGSVLMDGTDPGWPPGKHE